MLGRFCFALSSSTLPHYARFEEHQIDSVSQRINAERERDFAAPTEIVWYAIRKLKL
jgi:hypothetical protein